MTMRAATVLPRRAGALALAAALVLGACTDGEEPDDPTTTDEIDEDEDGEDDADTDDPDAGDDPEVDVPSEHDVPDTPAGEQLAWIMDAIQPGAEQSSPGQVADRMAPPLDEAIIPGQLIATFEQLGTQGPWEIRDLTDGDEQVTANVRSAADEGIIINLTVGEDGRMIGLFFAEDEDLIDPDTLEDMDAAVDALGDTAAETSVLIARVDDGCEPLVAEDAEVARAVGSTAKLYVLHAVSQAIEAGEVAWSDTIEVTDADRSLPTGALRDEPAGTEVTVQEAASAMIATSDNTATDMLITLVGREAVEDAVSALGHSDPELLTPFPRTREFFAIGWDEDRRAAWEDADTDERRAQLDELGDGADGVEVDDVNDAAWTSEVDWFASADDLCAAHAGLDLDDETLAEILGTNPGVAFDDEVWTDVAFKGGSAPGVLSFSWSFTSAAGASEGQRWFLAYTGNDPEVRITEREVVLIAQRAMELLADEIG